MKLLYTNENRLLVGNAKNIIENAGIAVVFKNEYAAGGAGEIAIFESWLELWVVDDSDYEKAMQAIESSNAPVNSKAWVCSHCKEENDASFEICWKCQNECS